MKPTTEIIEQYVAGQLSVEETVRFEALMKANPELQQNVLFEKLTVEGIRKSRHNELKARLNDISVSSLSATKTTSVLKTALTTAGVVTLGVGVYLFSVLSKDIDNIPESPSEVIFVDAPQENTQNVSFWDIDKITKLNSEEKTVLVGSEIKRPKKAKIVASKTSTAKTENKQSKSSIKKLYSPTITSPSFSEVSDENLDVKKVALEDIDEGLKNNSTEKPVELDVDINKKSVLRYRYFDRKLFLDGAFDKGEYEILEVNGIEGKSVFIFYLGKYYKVEVSDKLRELPLVTDKLLIQQLSLLRDK